MSRGRLAGWVGRSPSCVVGALAFGVLDDGGPPLARATGPATWPRPIACPQCDGQSVADSDSEAAKGIRRRIDERIADGASDAQIRDELAAAYGERVLLTPGRSGVSSLVWTLPVVAVVVAFAGLAYAFRRWRGDAAGRASDADRALVAQAQAAPGPDGERRRGVLVTPTDEPPVGPATRASPRRATAGSRPPGAASTPTGSRRSIDERDFLLRSLDDLEREHDAGDVDDHDYETLKDDYTARAARTIRAVESHQARARGRPAPAVVAADRRPVAGVLALRRAGGGAGGPGRRDGAGRARPSPATSASPPAPSSPRRCRRRARATTTGAIAIYDDVLADDPDNVEALTYKGWFQFQSTATARASSR